MGNFYGRFYADLREQRKLMEPKMKKPHKVTQEDLKDFRPTFVVASSYPKKLMGQVDLFSEWIDDPLIEWTDSSRVRYTVVHEVDVLYGTYDIKAAIEFYNSL